jgi:hypothetical protein
MNYDLEDVKQLLEQEFTISNFTDIVFNGASISLGVLHTCATGFNIDDLCCNISSLALLTIVSRYASESDYKYEVADGFDYSNGCVIFKHKFIHKFIEDTTMYINDTSFNPLFIHLDVKPTITLISLTENVCEFAVYSGVGTSYFRRRTMSILDELLQERL